MNDTVKNRDTSAFDPNIDLTQTLRRLSVPTDPGDAECCGSDSSVLLLSKDNDARKWGKRWIGGEGLQVIIPEQPAAGLQFARDTQASVIVVDAALRDMTGLPLYSVLADAADVLAPIIVLCQGERDVAALLDAGSYEIVRRPYNWRLIGKRVVTACRAAETRARLARVEESLGKSLRLANAARGMLRERQSFEPVTGLPNKTKFMDLLKRGMGAADRDGSELAVFVVGFTRFRLVIEAMGQEHADAALKQFGRNLSDCLHRAGRSQRVGKGLRTSAAATLDQFRFALMTTCPGAVSYTHLTLPTRCHRCRARWSP